MLKTLALKHALNLCSIKRRENILRMVMASVGIGETNPVKSKRLVKTEADFK